MTTPTGIASVEALAFVKLHGIVLEAAHRTAIPCLADAVAGAAVQGSWWSHPRGRAIFAATRAVRAEPAVLVCRIVDGKVSFVHERLWPALARLADRYPAARLARLREMHTPSGRHRIEEVPFPDWLDADTRAAAQALDEDVAWAEHAVLRACGANPP